MRLNQLQNNLPHMLSSRSTGTPTSTNKSLNRSNTSRHNNNERLRHKRRMKSKNKRSRLRRHLTQQHNMQPRRLSLNQHHHLGTTRNTSQRQRRHRVNHSRRSKLHNIPLPQPGTRTVTSTSRRQHRNGRQGHLQNGSRQRRATLRRNRTLRSSNRRRTSNSPSSRTTRNRRRKMTHHRRRHSTRKTVQTTCLQLNSTLRRHPRIQRHLVNNKRQRKRRQTRRFSTLPRRSHGDRAHRNPSRQSRPPLRPSKNAQKSHRIDSSPTPYPKQPK